MSLIQKHLWFNTTTLLFNSLVCSSLIMVLMVSAATPTFSRNHFHLMDWMHLTSPLAFTILAILTGNFAYNLWDLCHKGLHTRDLVVHHVIQLVHYCCALFKTIGHYILVLMILCEILHLRKS